MLKSGSVNSRHANQFVLIASAATRAGRAEDLPLRVLDKNGARLGQKLAPCGGCQRTVKVRISFARSPIVRLEVPIPMEAQALPVAISTRNMLAPSSRCSARRFPDSSRTTTAIGRYCLARAVESAASMILFACVNVIPLMIFHPISEPTLRFRRTEPLACRDCSPGPFHEKSYVAAGDQQVIATLEHLGRRLARVDHRAQTLA